MIRSIISSVLCLGLCGLALLLSPMTLRPNWRLDELGIFAMISVGLSALGLVFSAVLCLLARWRQHLPTAVVLAPAVLAMILACLSGYLGNYGTYDALDAATPDQRTEYIAFGTALVQGSTSLCLVWAGLCFLGTILVAGVTRVDENKGGEKASGDPLRWAWVASGLLAGVAVVLVAIIPRQSIDILLHGPGLGMILGVVVLVATPLLLLPIGRRLDGLSESLKQRLTAARVLGAMGLLGAVACFAATGPLIPGMKFLDIYSRPAFYHLTAANGGMTPGGVPLVWYYTAAQNAEWVLVIGAAIVSLLILSRLLRTPAKWAVPALMILATIGSPKLIFLPQSDYESSVPTCTEECQMDDLITAIFRGRSLPTLAPLPRRPSPLRSPPPESPDPPTAQATFEVP